MKSMESRPVQSDLPATLIALLKKVLLIAIGSGLISNALFIYGLAYYQGYIETFGFEYALFPTDWNGALLWTYVASREIGISTVNLWTDMGASSLLVIAFSFYMLARIWMASNRPLNKAGTLKRIPKRDFANLLISLRRRSPKVFKVLFPPLKWLFNTEQSLWAFVASYFAMIVVFFIPIFLLIWVYFPMIGNSHGESIAEKWMTRYEQSLCGDSDGKWSQCIEVTTAHLKQYELTKKLCGRLIAKKDDLLAIYTNDGPVTVTRPTAFYFKTATLKTDELVTKCGSIAE